MVKLAIVLTALLLTQALVIGASLLLTPVRVDLEVGKDVPFEMQGWNLGREEAKTQCRVAFVCRTNCAACRRLASAYADSLNSRIDEASRPIWLIPGDSVEVENWTRDRKLPDSLVYRVTPRKGSLLQRPRHARIWFTPMRLVLTNRGNVRDARPSDRSLPPAQLDSLCVAGGSAPGSLADLVEEQMSRPDDSR